MTFQLCGFIFGCRVQGFKGSGLGLSGLMPPKACVQARSFREGFPPGASQRSVSLQLVPQVPRPIVFPTAQGLESRTIFVNDVVHRILGVAVEWVGASKSIIQRQGCNTETLPQVRSVASA